ncbi:MAG: adenylosuccinate lyase [Planctomycetota bacterium]|nr:adenylosuccinate lyase [Planctomycetota bacterium]
MESQYDIFQSPLTTRSATGDMARIFSPRTRITTWRRIWLALAETEHELGLGIDEKQLRQLRDALDDIDFESAAAHEKTLRHDVMAHVHTYGEKAPDARGIIHLGATSQDVVCNADLIIFREALELVSRKLALVVHQLGTFAERWRALPTLGFTHYQPAQPTTVGRRAVMWAQDFSIALAEVEDRFTGMRLRGMRGATGTQASFLGLFDGDASKVDELERRVAEKLGWDADACWPVSGQTYPRLVDVQLLSALSTAAAAVHKTCNDIRLLANLRELQEPIERTQIGSSAMAYKRNPMRCERATGLSRFVISMWQNGVDTASTQWMERTLDDSSNRRLSLPEGFLALDNALDIMGNVTSGLVVNEAIIKANLQRELPFMATEDLMLAAANLGADRQDAHELIRTHSRAVAKDLMDGSTTNDLLERLAAEPTFKGVDMATFSDQTRFVGRAPEQVDRFINEVVEPIRARYEASFPSTAELSV